tara:strand:+ start:345 stop:782 length:438 start_codon:yes stop_codon:yes gene_type:complete
MKTLLALLLLISNLGHTDHLDSGSAAKRILLEYNIYEIFYEGTVDTKNLACNYSYEILPNHEEACVCVPKYKPSYNIDDPYAEFYKLNKNLTESKCAKTNAKVEKKINKIINKCLKKAGKMKTDSAFNTMYSVCVNENVPTSVIK